MAEQTKHNSKHVKRAVRNSGQEQNTALAHEEAPITGHPTPSASVIESTLSPDKPQTKTSLVLALLQRSEGATLDQLVAATGWLPHTTRAALTGLRKKGHRIEKTKVDGVTRYQVAAATIA